MTKEEREELRKNLLYLADCMILINDIENMQSCNDCGIKFRCAYCPRVGQSVRYTCPLFVSDEPKGGSKE